MSDYRRYISVLLLSACVLTALYVDLFIGTESVYAHLFYMPIILTALWNYEKGVYLSLFLGALDVMTDMYHTGSITLDSMVIASSYLIVGVTVAFVVRLSSQKYHQRLSEDDLRSSFNSVNDAIFIHSLDGKIVETNDHMAQMYGIPTEQAVNMSIIDFYSSSGQSKNSIRQAWENVLTGEELLFECMSTRPVEGSSFPAEVCLRRTRLRGMDVVIAAVRDITRRKEAEEELREARKRAELYVDLMGHDINNLNQASTGYLEIALDTLNLEDGGKNLLGKSLESIQHSSKLIDNVRKLQHLQAGEHPHEVVNLGTLLSDVKDEYGAIPDREVGIDYQPQEGFMVDASPMIREAFRNIVGNAVKHSRGSLEIRMALDRSFEDDALYYRTIIEDNGPGVPHDLKTRLFARMMIGTARTGGSGMGLYLARAVVEDAGGQIWVEDRVAEDYTKGSRFVVMLPAYRPWFS